MMSISTEELEQEAAIFLAAGHRYWKIMQQVGMGGAICWVKDIEGFGIIFTRGEYTDQLMMNIERLGPTKHFGCMKDD